MSEGQKEHSKKRDMLEALTLTLGVVTPALKKANVSRTCFYEWKKKDSAFLKEVEDIDDICLDFTESKLHQLIQAQNPAAVFFHLKTKGKGRGYIERQEFSGDLNHNHTGEVRIYLPDNGRPPAIPVDSTEALEV